ncbi:glycosyltransferase family 4 protein [Marinobacter salsuginis]|uniref:glycosyltransferase family 4 protein n=1 Tax=Marinobacter salsuginis TaxID=418719 RepID=UPI001C953FFC|nr:glycosyltransferase family 4 protein [Marinobacter salsuginis]MBY6070786.1 glycosyltransferase family 4 protein [Marinobacter salsuginis]
MKILLGHNYYRSSSPSGENLVYEMERQLLLRNGHSVTAFTRCSDTLSKEGMAGVIKGALHIPWNTAISRDIKKRLISENIDVLHAHNTFPMISPSVFWAARGLAARVMTLHNYRLFCANAIPLRGGKVCTECLHKRSALPAMLHGCYRNSRIATAPLATSVELHRRIGTWKHQVEAFICLSEFQRELMIDAGLPKHKVHVKPHFYPGAPDVVPWEGRRPAVIFAGRLGAEKGVANLIRAWQKWGKEAPELRIVGDGPLRSQLEKMAEGLPVKFLGRLTAEETQREISESMLQILPSECFETFGLVVREAFAFGTPSAVSNIGPLPSIVDKGVNGTVFEAFDPPSLLREVKALWETPGLLPKLGNGARKKFEDKYTEQTNYNQLIEIYNEAKEIAKFELSK